MPVNKKIYNSVKLTPSVKTIAYLELSTDGGTTFSIIDSKTIEANVSPVITDFNNPPTIDVDDPNVKVRVRLVPQTTTSTSTTTTTFTTTAAPSPFRKATSADAALIHNANVGDMLLTGGNLIYNEKPCIDIKPQFSNDFTLDGCKKILIKGGVYDYIRIECPGLSGTTECPIVITNYGGQVYCRTLGIVGLSHYKLTGKYDSIAQTGDVNFKGHANGYAFTADTYGIHVSNDWRNTADHLLSISGSYDNKGKVNFQSTEFEIEYIETGNGGFSNVIKTDGAGFDQPMNNVRIHDCYMHDSGGEGIYIGSTQSDPVHSFTNLHFYNNRVLRAGNDGVQFGQIAQGCIIENNVVHGAINWKSPFSGYQDNALQISVRNGGSIYRNNVFIGGGEKWINFFVNKIKDSTPSGVITIENNVFLHCRGTLGVYFGQSNPMEIDQVLLKSNFFGRFVYQYDEVYLPPLGNNSPNLIRDGMRCNLRIEGNRWDGSDGKLELYYPEPFAVPYIAEVDNIIDLIPDVEFIDYMGFPVGFDYLKVELWGSYVGGTYELDGSDYGWFPAEGTLKDTAIKYEIGDYVTWLKKIYKCKVANELIQPGVTANWTTYWEKITFPKPGGGFSDFPADDVRLTSTSFYNGRGMGLLANPAYNGPITSTTTTSSSTSTTSSSTTTTTSTLPVVKSFVYKTYAKDNGDNTYSLKWGINRGYLTNSPKVVGIGSSTLINTGNTAGNGLGDKLTSYFNGYGGTFINLGQGSYSTSEWSPSGTLSTVDNNKNSTAAVMLQPTFAVLMTATNDVENKTPEQALTNLLAIYNELRNNGIVCFIEACQPRTGYQLDVQLSLIHYKNLIKAYFPTELVIDPFEQLKDTASPKPANTLPIYSNPDGIHLNDAGIAVLYDIVRDRINATLIDSEFVSWEIERSTNPTTGFTLFDTVVGGTIVEKKYNRVDANTYYFRVRGKRANATYGAYTDVSNSLTQLKNIGAEEQVIQLDFSDNTNAFPPEDWNNLLAVPAGPAVGTIYANLLDKNYVTTNVEVEVIEAFTGTGAAGGTSIEKYPLKVVQDYWFKSNSTKPYGGIRIGNLDKNKIYKLELFSSRSGGDQRYIGFVCNGIYNNCFATLITGEANKSNTTFLSPLYPDNDGNLFIHFAGFPIGYLNAIIIHRHSVLAIGDTTTTTSSTSTSTSSTTTTTTTVSAPDGYTININFYNGENAIASTAWNNWNLGTPTSPTGFSNLKYANNVSTTYSASISVFENYFDNGEGYGEGIVPAEVLRNGFFTTETDFNATTATITLSGLNNANKYNFEFIGSRNNVSGNKTILQAIGSTTVNSTALTTDKNKTNSVKILGINPSSGSIVLKVRKNAGEFGYGNALKIFEILPVSTTTSTSTSTSSSTTTTSTTIYVGSSTTTSSSTTTTTTTIAGAGTFVKIGNWKTDSPNQYGWIYTPPGYDNSGATKYPFVVFLHGQGEYGVNSSGADILVNSGNGPGEYFKAGDSPQGVVYFIPQLNSSPGTWEPNWVEPARTFVINNYNGDATRFYLTGLSLGASGTSKYVMTYPDRVAAYIIATGDTQYQRGGNVSATVNGVRQVDVPGWFHGGVADGTISVNNGQQSLVAMNALSPKPIYPYLVNTYWGLGHSSAMWSGKVFNRKYKTTGGGTAAFDYIDWFKRFKANDLEFNSTSHVVLAENSQDYTDYLIALRLVEKLSSGTPKTNLLSRLATLKGIIVAKDRILLLNFGDKPTVGSMNVINTSVGVSSNNLVDIEGNSTNIGFTLVASQWSPPNITIGTNNEYFGFDTSVFSKGYRVYNTANTWRLTGLNNSKTYKIRFFFGDISQNNSQNSGGIVTINSVVKNLDNAMVNNARYVDFDNVVPSSGVVNMGLTSIQNNWQVDVQAMLVFESVTGGTTTTTTTILPTTTTTTTLAPTTTTTTTILPTTTTSSTTLSTSTTSSTTTTTTTLAPTTTTTTTVTPTAGVGKFSFAPAGNTYTQSGWVYINGNPATTDLTGTQNGFTVTNVKAKWQNIGGTGGDVDGGMSTGTFTDFPVNVVRGNWLNYSLPWYNPDSYNLIVSGLNTSKTYDIKIIGSVKSSLEATNTTTYRCVGNGDEWNPTILTLNNVDNSSNSITFTSITPNSSGNIKLGVNATSGSGNFGYISGLIISEVVTEAKFNFNGTAQSISGWNDVSGNPHAATITKTDSATGYTVSNIFATNKWQDLGGGTSSNVAGGTGTNADFPANVMLSYWFNAYGTYSSNSANMKISNLTPSTSYQLKMIGSRSSVNSGGISTGQNRIMEYFVSQSATKGHASEQSNSTYAARDSVTTQTFTITSNSSGEIYMGVYCSIGGNGANGDQFGYINGLIVTKV